MGRQQYLERLALGRSAVEDLESTVDLDREQQNIATGGSSNDSAGLVHEQQYDNKGRAVNPQTEKRNAAMRNAQNAVLALVGVVESKDERDRLEEAKYRPLQESRDQMLQAEQEWGEALTVLATGLSKVLLWWPETLTARIQAGVYDSSLSFGDILTGEVAGAREYGSKHFLLTFLSGIPAYLLHLVLDYLLLGNAIDYTVGPLTKVLGYYAKRRKQGNGLRQLSEVLQEGLCVIGDILLMPLLYYAETQRLGLAPPLPLLPSWRSPWCANPYSKDNIIWQPPTGLYLFKSITSPALLLLLRNSLYRYQTDEQPIFAQSMNFKYPSESTKVSQKLPPDPREDPIGSLAYCGYLIRTKILKWLGWQLEEHPLTHHHHLYANNQLPSSTSLANEAEHDHTRAKKMEKSNDLYRSTSLSTRPAKYLAVRLDEIFAKVLVLPFESLIYRAITHSYLASSLPRTHLAMTAAQTYYSPSGGGPLGQLRRFGFSNASANGICSYLSKLGLSLAFSFSVDVGFFFVLYGISRWQGLQSFGWGKSRQASNEESDGT